MNYGVERYWSFDNELCCDLTNLDIGLPRSFWLTAHLREFSSFQTKLSYAYQAKYYFEYFDSLDIDIVDRVESGLFFTKMEIQDFLSKSLYKVSFFPNPTTKTGNVTRLTTKSIDNLIYSTRHSNSRVSSNTTKARIQRFISFIRFLYSNCHGGNKTPIVIELRYKDCIERMFTFLDRLAVYNNEVNDPFEQAIPTETYFKLLDCTKPHHKDNPWAKQSRLRNHLLVQLFNETGIRVGALCKLKISDLITNKPSRIRISRTPNDITDPRAKPAAQKTKPHTSAISEELMQRLLLYVETDRKKYPKSKNHDFVFISEKGKTKGQPISIQGVEHLFKRLSKLLDFRVFPHLMRHKFQEIFQEAAEEMGLSPERIDDLRRYACGWAKNSTMVEVYNEHKIALAAWSISTEAQRSILSGLEELSENGS